MKIRSTKYPELSLRIGNSFVEFQDGLGETTAPSVVKAVRNLINEKPEWGLKEIKGFGDENPEEGLV